MTETIWALSADPTLEAKLQALLPAGQLHFFSQVLEVEKRLQDEVPEKLILDDTIGGHGEEVRLTGTSCPVLHAGRPRPHLSYIGRDIR